MALLHSASLVVFSSCLEQFGEEQKMECWTSNILKIEFDTKGKGLSADYWRNILVFFWEEVY